MIFINRRDFSLRMGNARCYAGCGLEPKNRVSSSNRSIEGRQTYLKSQVWRYPRLAEYDVPEVLT